MNKRQNDLLKTLYGKKSFVTLAELAEKLGVSVKTVRNDISVIREFLSEQSIGEIQTKPHIGVHLIISDEDFKRLDRTEKDDEREIFFFIVRNLLKHNNITAQKLADRYYMGRNQLDKILDRVSRWLSERHIFFEQKRGKGISIRYSEFNYRLACLDFYRGYADMYEKLINERRSKYGFTSSEKYTAMCSALDGFEADNAAELIIDTEKEFGLKMSYMTDESLLFLVSLTVMRVRQGISVSMPEVPAYETDGESDRLMALSLTEKIENRFNIVLEKQETDFLAFIFSTAEIQGFSDDSARRRFELLNTGLCRLTVKMVNLSSEISGVDLREDKFFVRNMFLQLKVTISRLKYGIIFKNQLLGSIKSKYPNMMATAWLLGNVFEKELGIEINENEVGFLALHIGGAIERRLLEISACIVCDYGIGISQILREKISRSIPDLKITGVFSVRDIRSIKNEQCDFIITTSSLSSYRIDRSVIEVDHILSDRDIKNIEEHMRKVSVQKRGGVKNIRLNTGLFTKELIFPNIEETDKTEILTMLCKRLENLGYVTENFAGSVLDREKSTATDIGKGFALPHGLSTYVNHSAVVFARLKTPIEWTDDGEKADIIFLLAFDLNEDKTLRDEIIKFYKSIVSFMDDDEKCAMLRNTDDADKIIKIFEMW